MLKPPMGICEPFPGENDADGAGGIDTGAGSSLTVVVDDEGRVGADASGPDVRAFDSEPKSSSSLSHKLTTSSKLMTTELPDAPCASSARSLQGKPANRLDVEAEEAETRLGPVSTDIGCLNDDGATETDVEGAAD